MQVKLRTFAIENRFGKTQLNRMLQFNRPNDLALLILRLSLGAFMIYGHGYPKLLRLFGGEEIKFMDFLGLGPVVSLALATFAEVVCSLLIMSGLYTRIASGFLIITMAVAAFIRHAPDPFSTKEKALLYLVGFIAIAIAGAGWYSLDAKFRNKI